MLNAYSEKKEIVSEKKKNKRKKDSGKREFHLSLGFTLIEMLITIFLVSVGLIGVLAFFNSSLQSNFEAKNEIIAAGLAQEATELVRNIVDYNFLNPPNKWYDELTNKDTTDPVYCSKIDRDVFFGTNNYKCKSNPKAKPVCFNSTTGVYYNCPNNSASEKTIFEREIKIEGNNTNGVCENSPTSCVDLDAGDCLNVVATVGWPTSNSSCESDILSCPYKTVSTDIICEPRQ